MRHLMRGTSADSVDELLRRLDDVVRGGTDGAEVGRELFSVAALLHGEASLRRVLTDPSRTGESKAELTRGLLGGKVAPATLDLVAAGAAERWAGTRDLPDALEYAGVIAVVKGAEQAGQADELEDGLFAFTRLLADNPQLRDALSDPARSLSDKRQLLHGLLQGKLESNTLQLIDQALASSYRSAQVAVEQYLKIAAAHRQRLVAEVRVARPLGQVALDRLATALRAQYGQAVKLTVIVDPQVIGGMRVEIGDDVIDGTVVNRLDDARRRLAG